MRPAWILRAVLLGAFFACASSLSPFIASAEAARDPQQLLKEADRQLRSGDTMTALQTLRACVTDPAVKEWMIEEAMKLFAATYRAPSDSPLAYSLFSLAMRSPKADPVIPGLLSLLAEYPPLTSEEKLSILSGLPAGGKAGEEILFARIQLLRRLGRLDPAVELAARLAQATGRIDHRVLVVDLFLDLSRSADAVSLSNTILTDAGADPSSYSLLAERFYRHGDYRNALDIHRRARAAFSNPMLFFDQSLSICQGLQLSKEGIELYLPVLLDGTIPAPEFYREFIAMITDTDFLTKEYPAWIRAGRNPNLYLIALFRFAEIAPEHACLEFARSYRDRFQQPAAHLGLAEKLLEHNRLQVFSAMLADLPDTPVEVAESKRVLLYKSVIREAGAEKALEQFPPASFTSPTIRASLHRIAAQDYLSRMKLPESIFSLKAAQSLSAEPADDLRLAQMYFMAGADSEALESAYRAHRAAPTDETLYWLGWLSFIRQDTETARKAFRDVVLRSDNFLADESLGWLIALGRGAGEIDPAVLGQAIRDAARGRPDVMPAGDHVPIPALLAVRRHAIRAGLPPKTLPADGSPFLQYLRWAALASADRTDAEYQKLLRAAPEYLRPLIRIDEP